MEPTEEIKHSYPSNYGPGISIWTDLSWNILDRLKPGLIPDDARAYLAGLIAGSLVRAYTAGHKNESPERIRSI